MLVCRLEQVLLLILFHAQTRTPHWPEPLAFLPVFLVIHESWAPRRIFRTFTLQHRLLPCLCFPYLALLPGRRPPCSALQLLYLSLPCSARHTAALPPLPAQKVPGLLQSSGGDVHPKAGGLSIPCIVPCIQHKEDHARCHHENSRP